MSAKKFLIIYFSAYIGIALIANVLLGPPGQSSDYLEKHKDDHARYQETVKSAPYKHFTQLTAAGVDESEALDRIYAPDEGKGPHEELLVDPPRGELERNLPFVREYASREDYQQEQARIWRYGIFFDFYNSLSLIVLVIWFGRKPFATFADGQIERVRARIDRAQRTRDDAGKRLAEAKGKLEGLEKERVYIQEQTERVIAQEVSDIQKGTEDTLAQIDTETEARLRVEEQAALARVQRELVDQAIGEITERLRQSVVQKHQTDLVNEFAKQIEGLVPARGESEHG
jgi:F-type H+-transporting ATPase subunit b